VRTAGLVILLGLAAGIIVAGLISPDGLAMLGPANQLVTATGRSLRHGWSQLHITGIAGNGQAAAVVGLAMFAGSVILVPPSRAGRGMAVAAVAAVAVGLLLYSPALLGGAV
jgi:hypothetical protein